MSVDYTAFQNQYIPSDKSETFFELLTIFVMSLICICVLTVHVVLKNTQYPARLPFILLVGWACGKTILTLVITQKSEKTFAEHISPPFMHLLVALTCFFSTTNVDYHTFSRNMFQILGASLPAFMTHLLLVTVILYPIMAYRSEWQFHSTLTLAALVSSVQVDNTLAELRNVNAQLRKLHLLLQGEKIVSIVCMAYTTAYINKFRSPLNTSHPTEDHLMAYAGWLIVGALPGLTWGLLYRYPLSFSYNDTRSQAFLALVSIPMCYFFSEFFGSSGALSVILFGIALGCSKAKISSESESFFKVFWDVIAFALVNITFLLCGFLIGSSSNSCEVFDLGMIVVFYGLCMISRMLSMSFMGIFFVSRNEWIPWKHYIIALYGVYKGSPNLILVSFSFAVLRTQFSYDMMVYVTSVVLVSHFVNVNALRKLLGALGMYDLTQSRVINMDGAVTHVNHCREKSIMSLKMDRIIADANWLVVDQSTKLQHPYRRVNADSQSNDDIRSAQIRLITCGECGAESVASPTKKELVDITIEAKHKILKAQMMSFWKQNESGTLADHSYRLLTNLVETASVRDNPVLSYKDLKIQREGSQVLRNMRSFFGFLSTITSTTHSYIPTNWLRALCFRLCSTKCFQVTFVVLCLIDLSILSNFLLLYYFYYEEESKNGYSTKYYIYQAVDFFFFFVFFVEFIILSLGISIIHYFHSNVNKIEFATGMLMRPAYLLMVVDTYYRKKVHNIFLGDPIIMSTKALLLMRFARIFIFFVALIPNLLNAVNKKMDDDLLKAYDLGKAYLIALNKVIKFLGYIVENDVVYNQLVDYMEMERRTVTKELGLIQKDLPTIGVTLKTRHAIRHVINTMSECAAMMKEDGKEFVLIINSQGMLDSVERRKIQNSLIDVKKRIRSLLVVTSNAPEAILKEVPWMCGDQEACNLLWDYAVLSSYREGEVIIRHGDDPAGLFILVSGLVHCVYKPSAIITEVVILPERRRLQKMINLEAIQR